MDHDDPNKCEYEGCGRTRVTRHTARSYWCREHYAEHAESSGQPRLAADLRAGATQWPVWTGSVVDGREIVAAQDDALVGPWGAAAYAPRSAPGGDMFAPLSALTALTDAVRALCGGLGECAACGATPAMNRVADLHGPPHAGKRVCKRCGLLQIGMTSEMIARREAERAASTPPVSTDDAPTATTEHEPFSARVMRGAAGDPYARPHPRLGGVERAAWWLERDHTCEHQPHAIAAAAALAEEYRPRVLTVLADVQDVDDWGGV